MTLTLKCQQHVRFMLFLYLSSTCTLSSMHLILQTAKHIYCTTGCGRLFNQSLCRHISYKMASPAKQNPQKYDYFLVLDFEATCDNNKKIIPQEIIEFPVIMVNARTLEREAVFHHYVQPRIHPELTSFCTELTGIIQDMVDETPHLEEVLQEFDKWMNSNHLLDGSRTFTFVTCGDWDLKTMLPSQCHYFRIDPKKYFNRWINIKKSFSAVTGTFPRGMMFMLQELKIPHEGRHHCGIDDCRNIANILCSLVKHGFVF